MDQIPAEERETGTERHRPHQRDTVGLHEDLREQATARDDRAHRGIDRLAHDAVDAIGEDGVRGGKADRADAGQAAYAVCDDQRALDHEQAAQASAHERQRETRVPPHGASLEAPPHAVRRG